MTTRRLSRWTRRHSFDCDTSGLIDWCADALDAIDTGDTERARRAVLALRAWLEAKAAT